ncbi:MAG TPA: hypothetical protein V6C72_01265, partial [Chroococcales cyanobacterium]
MKLIEQRLTLLTELVKSLGSDLIFCWMLENQLFNSRYVVQFTQYLLGFDKFQVGQAKKLSQYISPGFNTESE